MKIKKQLLRTFAALMFCFLWGAMYAHAEKKAWVKYENGTLTFLYGDKENLGEDEYDLNEGDARPAWDESFEIASNVTKAVFDASFKDARPTSCAYWFYWMDELTDIEGIDNLNTSQVTNMRNMFLGCSNLSNIDVSHFETANVTDMSNMFWRCSKLSSIDVSHFETANVTNMEGMFGICRSLQFIFSGDGFTTANVTDSKDMFSKCSILRGAVGYHSDKTTAEYANTANGYFTNVADKGNAKYYWLKYADGTATFYYGKKESIGDGESYMKTGAWDNLYPFEKEVTKVVMDESFRDARPTVCSEWFSRFKNFTTIEGIENLNTSEVTDMSDMFYACVSLTHLDLSHFDTSKVTDMNDMFWGCYELAYLDVSSFNTSNVTNMAHMFCICKNLTSLDVSRFNTSNVTDMSGMFWGCESVAALDVSHFDTSKTTNMQEMFRECSVLRSLDLSNFNTSNVVSFNMMFANCCYLANLDLSNFNTDKLELMDAMFWYCPSLRYIFVGDGFKTGKVTIGQDVFKCCFSLTGAIDFQDDKTDYTYANTENGYFTDVKQKDQAKYIWARHTDDTFTLYFGKKDKLGENEEYMTACYREIEPYTVGITKVVIDDSFKDARPVSYCGYFADFSNLTDIEGIENLNTSKARDLTGMFYGCKKLTSLDLSGIDTRNVTGLSNMFYDCPNLKSVYLSDKFNTSKVEDSEDMFYGSNPTIYCRPDEYAAVKADKCLDGRKFMAYVHANPDAEYGTLCVPQGCDLAADSYTGFDKIYSVDKCETGNDGYVLLKVKSKLEPGVAYIYHRDIYADGNAKAEIAYEPNEAVAAEPQTQGLLRGIFMPTVAPAGSYILEKDAMFHLTPSNGTTSVLPYSAYLLPSAGASLPNTLPLQFATDGIEEITCGDGVSESGAVYDLTGCPVKNPVKGRVYIKNGKKIIL